MVWKYLLHVRRQSLDRRESRREVGVGAAVQRVGLQQEQQSRRQLDRPRHDQPFEPRIPKIRPRRRRRHLQQLGVVAEHQIVAVDDRAKAAWIDGVSREVAQVRNVRAVDGFEQPLVDGRPHDQLIDDDQINRWCGTLRHEAGDDLRRRSGDDLDRRPGIAFERRDHQPSRELFVDAAVQHHAQARRCR